ncbi:MAG: diguanylate cyclase [Sulfurospirillaceae bacterium]|nr:diguanylate cyclase [Sulfurospirillaceae bacterium]
MMHTFFHRLGIWRYVLVVIFISILMIVILIKTISLLRQEAISTHRHIAQLHAQAIEEHFSQTLQTVNNTIDQIPFLSSNQDSYEIIEHLFQILLRNAPYIRSFSLLDMQGKILTSSTPANQNISIDLQQFLPIPFEDKPLLRIGVPWVGRDFSSSYSSTPKQPVAKDHISFIPVIKKIFFNNKPYIIAVALNTDYFNNQYLHALPLQDGTVSLWRIDGILLFSSDKTLLLGSSHNALTHSLNKDIETLVAHFATQHHTLIDAYKLASTMPFVVDIEMHEDFVLGYWDKERHKILLISVFLISLSSLLVLLLFLRYYKEVLRQKQQISYEKQFRLAMEATQTGLWTWHYDTNVLTWDPECYLLLGYQPFEFEISWEKLFELTHPDDANSMFASIQSQITEHPEFVIERRMRNPKGQWVWIQVRGKVIEYTLDNKPLFLTGVYININTQRQAEELRISAVAFETQEAILITDASEKILKVNHAFTKITGYSSEEIIGKSPRILKSNKHDKAFYQSLWHSLETEGYWQGELWNKRKNGEIYAEYIMITAIRNEVGIITHYLANFNDITNYKAAEEKIHELAYYDPLTHLANRRLLHEKIDQILSHNHQNYTIYYALVFLDLDHFKQLNDTFGHDAGDMLLVQVAKRLLDCTRSSDIVSRPGGDEFVILLENLGNNALQSSFMAQSVAKKILFYLNKPYELAHGEYTMGASIGITLFSNDGTKTLDVLMKEADSAMYSSKSKGRNQICFYEHPLVKENESRLT